MAKPKISAIMPTYNRAVFLPVAIDSILEQTFKDFELVVYDDGSTDSTPALMAWYAAQDDRVKYVKSTKNRGVGYARNAAIKKSSGDIIVQCDSDDVQHKDRFKEVAKAFKKDKDLDIFYHSFFTCSENLTIINNRIAMPFNMGELFKQQYIIGTCAYRRKVWEQVPYNPKLKVGEEWEFLIKCGLKKMKFGWTKKPLLKYRIHEGSMSINAVRDIRAYDWKMVERLKKEWDGVEYMKKKGGGKNVQKGKKRSKKRS